MSTVEAVNEPADDRREEIHPDDVKGDDESDDFDFVVALVHVEWGDGHDGHHHALPDRHGEDSNRGESVGHELAERVAESGSLRCGWGPTELFGQHQWVGPLR